MTTIRSGGTRFGRALAIALATWAGALGAGCGGASGGDVDVMGGPGMDEGSTSSATGAGPGTGAGGGYYGDVDDVPPVLPPAQPGEEAPENDFIATADEPTSTFSVDVDTGSYSIMRRAVDTGTLPDPAGVRPEEYLNYFENADAGPDGGDVPFAVHLAAAPSLFGDDLHLVRIGIRGKQVPVAERQPANLVFLVDVSGSMASSDKLGLVQYALKQLVARLEPTDTLGIVVYAGHEATLLEPTPIVDKDVILDAIDDLEAGGSTNGEAGIARAYDLAEAARRDQGINRVILCTDGDFNVGLTGDPLIDLIEDYRDRGIFLTTLGFGSDGYQDATLEQLADKGNGQYAYIDGPGEAVRFLGEKLVGTLQVIAKDVKIQVEFDPTAVARYRLVGYENRHLENEDFADDSKDAGEIGAGHTVTALYEVELVPQATGDLGEVRVRFKAPDGDTSELLERPLARADVAASFDAAPADLRFSAAVAEYAEILRHSKHVDGPPRWEDVLAVVAATKGDAEDRAQLERLVGQARDLWPAE